jgi:2-polyprenyl-6-methoxyphenol hydroxylase-like FAD-dependent oxidoreductase
MTPYRSVLVVGGGTAGWLAAAYLQRTIGSNQDFPVSITLVESREIGTIGVGEATVPTLRNMMSILGIPESSLFAKAEATLKNGIRFVGWRNGGGADTDRYDHPFDPPMSMEGYSAMTHWLNLKQRGMVSEKFCDIGVVQTALFDDCRSPKLMTSPNYEAPISYAYHLDANLLASLLRDVAVSRGVKHVEGNVVGVDRDDQGIKSVRLADGSVHEADLFVDCTGFRSLLIGDSLEVPWVSYSDSLLCDRAVACPVAHAGEDAPLRSYTTATAKGAGWIWEIDLQSRKGSGYVYSSAFCGEEEAEAVLHAHNGGAERLADARHLRMRVGHRERVWEKNCLSLGLASGFIEPLESTGIYMIEYALQLFMDYLPVADGEHVNQRKFNALMSDIYDELRDFIVLHYVLTQREDTPFWRTYRNEVKLPASLLGLLVLWDEKIPTAMDLNRKLSLFGAANWFFILSGMDRLPSLGVAHSPYLSPDASKRVLAQVAQIRKVARAQSPTMRDYAKKVRSAMVNAPVATIR